MAGWDAFKKFAKQIVSEEKIEEIKNQATAYTVIGKAMLEQVTDAANQKIEEVKEKISEEISNIDIGGILGGNTQGPAPVEEVAAPVEQIEEAPFTVNVNKEGGFTPEAKPAAKAADKGTVKKAFTAKKDTTTKTTKTPAAKKTAVKKDAPKKKK